jgi:hypothetical protein
MGFSQQDGNFKAFSRLFTGIQDRFKALEFFSKFQIVSPDHGNRANRMVGRPTKWPTAKSASILKVSAKILLQVKSFCIKSLIATSKPISLHCGGWH